MKLRPVVGLVLAVDAIALVAGLHAWNVGGFAHAGTVLLLALLAGLVASRPVFVPALKTEVACSDAFALCAVASLGSFEAAVVALGTVLGVVMASKKRPSALHLAFNLGVLPLSVLMAGLFFGRLGGTVGGSLRENALPLTLATVLYFVVNTGLVSAAEAIDRNRSFFGVWRASFLWTSVAASSGLAVAAALTALLRAVGPWVLVLGIPPAWLLAVFYRTNRDRIEEQGERIEAVEGINAQLEKLVAQRTKKIQEVLSHVEAMNRQLRDSNEALVEANRIKSEFLAKVSHELRTPLNAVLGFSDLLADPSHGNLTSHQQEFLADIRGSGEHLLHLINNILDLSKIEAGRVELNVQDVTVGELLRDSSTMVVPQAGRKRILLAIECAEDVEKARIDAGMFREIVVNLMSNAVKFTADGGRVSVSARRSGQDLVLEVADTGIGIAPEHQAKIFEEFYQVDGSYTREYEGTGLGLALVRRLVELHGGGVAVESALGVGATFRCVFPSCVAKRIEPRHPAEAPAEAVAAFAAPAEDVRSRTVLVVEDNAVNRKLARNALRPHGWRVLEAKTGEEALEILRQHRPDIVLMDLQLPGMDGLETTRRIKADPLHAGLPVVALTAHTKTLDEERALSAGCVAYLTKPIRLTQFPGQIEALLEPREILA